jgi:hypothetical protein
MRNLILYIQLKFIQYGLLVLLILALTSFVTGCAKLQDNTTVGDKIIVGGSILLLSAFAATASQQ